MNAESSLDTLGRQCQCHCWASSPAKAQRAAQVTASSEMAVSGTCVDVAQDAADWGAQVVLGAGLHGRLEARLTELLLPRQALLALLLAVRRAALRAAVGAAIGAAAVLLTHHTQAQNATNCLPPPHGRLHDFTAH